jgi:nucleoside-diphosphate-sugar epimerase
MNVLIVGGAGYLGGAVTQLLLGSGHELRVYDALLYEDMYLKDVPFVLGDVRDRGALAEQLAWADTVIWLAAIVGDGACAISPTVTTEVNYDAVQFLANTFDGRIIFMSTCSVYGARDEDLDETSPTNPLSLYASTKLQAEQALQGKNALIFRLGTLFGLGDAHSRPRFDLVVNTLTAKALSDKRLQVFGGEQYRPLLHVQDAAQAIADNIGTNHVGIFNLHGENTKIVDLAKKVQLHVPGTELAIVATSFEDARNYRVSSQEATDTWGFKPQRSAEHGIIEMKQLLETRRVKDTDNQRYNNHRFLATLQGEY